MSEAPSAPSAGGHQNTQVDGIPELKDAICAKFERENGLLYRPENISVGTGGKQVLFNALMATVQEGDEVIIPAPYWVGFAGIVEVAGGGGSFAPDSRTAADARRARRRHHPEKPLGHHQLASNPTGIGYTADELLAFADVIRRIRS